MMVLVDYPQKLCCAFHLSRGNPTNSFCFFFKCFIVGWLPVQLIYLLVNASQHLNTCSYVAMKERYCTSIITNLQV